jgi:hypothetical protein
MLINIPKVTTTEAIQRICDAFQVGGLGFDGSYYGLTLVFYGRAGCGKTYATKEAARRLGCQHRAVDGITYTPTDVIGQRMIPLDGGDHVKQYFADWTKGLDVNEPAIINLSEFTKASPLVAKAMLNVLQERRAGSLELGRRWMFVLDGNLSTDKGGDVDIIGPARNRAAQFIVQNTEQTWLRDYAQPNNLHYYVTTFVERHGAGSSDFPDGVLNTWDGAENPAAWSSERAFDNVSRLLTAGLPADQWAGALLGNQVGEFFRLHCKLIDQLPDADEVLSNPGTAPVPDDSIVCHYAGAMIAYYAAPENMDAICTYLRRFPFETAATAAGDIIKRHPECKETRAYIQFRSEYKLSV